MAWPIQVHSIDSDKAWQMAFARPGVTFAPPMSRELIFLIGPCHRKRNGPRQDRNRNSPSYRYPTSGNSAKKVRS
jgi:hypothetical protein